MAEIGQELIALHLLTSPKLDPPISKYEGGGEDEVIREVRYEAQTHRVQINSQKYFEGITPAIWAYQIGGYQVLSKYLKDRKGRQLEDPVHYLRVATAIAHTLTLQQEIDEVYTEVEANPKVDFSPAK
jgi:hypothetical protein